MGTPRINRGRLILSFMRSRMVMIFIGAIGGMLLRGIIGLFIGGVALVLGYTLSLAWLDVDQPSYEGKVDTV